MTTTRGFCGISRRGGTKAKILPSGLVVGPGVVAPVAAAREGRGCQVWVGRREFNKRRRRQKPAFAHKTSQNPTRMQPLKDAVDGADGFST